MKLKLGYNIKKYRGIREKNKKIPSNIILDGIFLKIIKNN